MMSFAFSLTPTVTILVLREAVGAPSLIHIAVAGKVLKHGFSKMPGSLMAAEAPVGLPWSEKRATATLATVFVESKARGLARPFFCISVS
ncbi:hypothetical protein Pan181_38560 [Aeoliella mucimassa]|uniref:Uncharacterized protein n=1 Tax=Aeoliella mucimassa TaxID=2527972 RepID=A0A518ASH7_9BACT|nr:hypothetical protein Pan181_38560 [Aeoliella mucimassa]